MIDQPWCGGALHFAVHEIDVNIVIGRRAARSASIIACLSGNCRPALDGLGIARWRWEQWLVAAGAARDPRAARRPAVMNRRRGLVGIDGDTDRRAEVSRKFACLLVTGRARRPRCPGCRNPPSCGRLNHAPTGRRALFDFAGRDLTSSMPRRDVMTSFVPPAV